VKRSHERGGGDRHISRNDQVNLWHRRDGSCAATVRLVWPGISSLGKGFWLA
jgi:hypothetical protein